MCVDCPNSQACDDCGPGWYAAVIGATSAVHCLKCGEGKMLKAKHSMAVCYALLHIMHALTEASASGSVFKGCVDLITA